MASFSSRSGSSCLSKPARPLRKLRPRVCSAVRIDWVTIVTAMLKSSITIATPIKMSSVLSTEGLLCGSLTFCYRAAQILHDERLNGIPDFAFEKEGGYADH